MFKRLIKSVNVNEVLMYGGGSCPELADLVAIIVEMNWPMVATLAVESGAKSNPIVIRALKES